MSIFQNPGYLNLARQSMAGGAGQPPSNPYAGRFPDMAGLSKSPTADETEAGSRWAATKAGQEGNY